MLSRNLPEFQDQDRAQMFAQEVEPVAQPSTASGIGQVDVLGSTAPVGLPSRIGAEQGNLRQMASNNPEVARALGIRGATAGITLMNKDKLREELAEDEGCKFEITSFI